mmetsp:Transcript_42972/g.93356  ORF Transcript_42972/g.93356 Transcript_42972/m.93356 type:complete len:226 (-) Transcript_42972:1047-1724(-)
MRASASAFLSTIASGTMSSHVCLRRCTAECESPEDTASMELKLFIFMRQTRTSRKRARTARRRCRFSTERTDADTQPPTVLKRPIIAKTWGARRSLSFLAQPWSSSSCAGMRRNSWVSKSVNCRAISSAGHSMNLRFAGHRFFSLAMVGHTAGGGSCHVWLSSAPRRDLANAPRSMRPRRGSMSMRCVSMAENRHATSGSVKSTVWVSIQNLSALAILRRRPLWS